LRYAQLRYQVEGVLQESGLFFPHVDHRVETIDIANRGRSGKVSLHRVTPRGTEPFDVSAMATWIRYSPPSGATPVEPWFDDQAEENDGGPEASR
jgi:hypothetical protein